MQVRASDQVWLRHQAAAHLAGGGRPPRRGPCQDRSPRIGPLLGLNRYFAEAEPNLAVFAISCVAMMLARQSKSVAATGEDEFLQVTGAGPQSRQYQIDVVSAGCWSAWRYNR